MFTDSLELSKVLQNQIRFEAREEVGIGKKSDTRKLGKLDEVAARTPIRLQTGLGNVGGQSYSLRSEAAQLTALHITVPSRK